MGTRITRTAHAAKFASIRLCVLVACTILLPETNGRAADVAPQPAHAAGLHELQRNRVAWATAANDIGAVAGDQVLSHMTVVLRDPARQAAFEQLLKEQQDPGSPNFHHWLTPVEIGEKFGASAHDIGAVTDWLQSQGLHVDAVANSRMRIDFSGSAAKVGAAFASPIHAYLVNGERQIATAGVPRIPATLSAMVQSVRGLATITAHSHHGAGTAQFPAEPASGESIAGTFGSGTQEHYIFPADFAAIYAVNPVYQQGIDGSGQTIAVIGRARVYLPDIENFQSRAGLVIKDPVIIVPPGGIDPGAAKSSGGNPSEDQLEATIDVSRATSVAPGATIDLVVSADSSDSAGVDGLAIASQYVVDKNPVTAHIISISFGACEAYAGQSGVDFYDNLFRQAAAEGISVFVISGDSGVAGCDPYLGPPPVSQVASSNYICVSSYATCVGGTQFADTANPDAYWGANNGSGFESALGYIPEGAWNEPLDGSGYPRTAATGGGKSAYIPRPYWQTGQGVPQAQGRYTPDVSFSASVHDGYFACLAAAGRSCVANSNGQFGFEYFYGTSASTPDMAGVAALLNQKMGGAQGNLNPRLYALAATPGAEVFHDVTVSTSAVPDCSVSIPSMCNNTTPGPGGLSGGLPGYLVTPGYDEATGLGSINVANLLAQWNSNATVPVNIDQHGLTGSWYNPATGGQGIEMEVYPDLLGLGQGLLFAGWFTFDVTAAGGQRWYVLSGNVDKTSSSAQLTIGAVEGGNFDAPPALGASAVGQADLQFSDCNHATMSYNFTDGSGRSGTFPLARLTSNITCAAGGDNGSAATDYLLSGNWYDADTGGQGLIFDINPAQALLFATWYTFAPNGQQIGGASSERWYTLQTGVGRFVDGAGQLNDIAIGETTGGVFNDPASPTTVQVGSADIAFQNCNALTLAYRFTSGTNQGKSGTINLTRVGPPPAGCSL